MTYIANSEHLTQDQIKLLPASATAAFLARTIRRAEDLARAKWFASSVAASRFDELDETIARLEDIGRYGVGYALKPKFFAEAKETINKFHLALAIEKVGTDVSSTLTYFLHGIQYAHDFLESRNNKSALYCYLSAVHLLPFTFKLSEDGTNSFILTVNQDFAKVVARATSDNWADITRVKPNFFGKLWPEGKPQGWPVIRPIISKTTPGVITLLQRPDLVIGVISVRQK